MGAFARDDGTRLAEIGALLIAEHLSDTRRVALNLDTLIAALAKRKPGRRP